MTSGGSSADHRHESVRSRRERATRIGRRMVEEWTHDRVPDTAAAVAFWAVLSLLPAFLTLAALLGPLDTIVGGDVAEQVQDRVLDFLGTVLTAEAEGTIDAARDLFEEERPGLLTFSLAAAFWTVSRAFAGLVRALDVVYDLDERRGWVQLRLTALVIALGTVVTTVVMLAVLVVGPLLGTGAELADRIGLGDQWAVAWDVLRLPVAFVVLVAWAATIFHVGPDHRTPWRSDVPGAVLTAVLWLLFSGGLRLYLELAQAGNAVFGTLGGALIVLLWFWLLSLAILVGGELNQVLLEEPNASGGVDGVAQAGDEGTGVDGGAAVEEEAHDGRGDDHPVGRGGGGRRGLG